MSRIRVNEMSKIRVLLISRWKIIGQVRFFFKDNLVVKKNTFGAKYELVMSSGAFYEQFKSYEVLHFSPLYSCSHYWPHVVKYNNLLKRSQNGENIGYFNRIRAITEQNKSTSNLLIFWTAFKSYFS